MKHLFVIPDHSYDDDDDDDDDDNHASAQGEESDDKSELQIAIAFHCGRQQKKASARRSCCDSVSIW